MPKNTWSIKLYPYDHSGHTHKTVKADSCSVYDGRIAFYNNVSKTDDDPFPESLLIAYIPTDRVFELEILDDETGEPVGFLFQGSN